MPAFFNNVKRSTPTTLLFLTSLAPLKQICCSDLQHGTLEDQFVFLPSSSLFTLMPHPTPQLAFTSSIYLQVFATSEHLCPLLPVFAEFSLPGGTKRHCSFSILDTLSGVQYRKEFYGFSTYVLHSTAASTRKRQTSLMLPQHYSAPIYATHSTLARFDAKNNSCFFGIPLLFYKKLCTPF